MFSPTSSEPSTFASLCLYGESLDPEVITARTGVRPTDRARKGDRRPGSKKGVAAPTGRWILCSEQVVKSTDLEKHVEWILSQVRKFQTPWRKLENVERAIISCYWLSAEAGGPCFSSAVLRKLADEGVDLWIDYYPDFTSHAKNLHAHSRSD